jgi:hypothetical protein
MPKPSAIQSQAMGSTANKLIEKRGQEIEGSQKQRDEQNQTVPAGNRRLASRRASRDRPAINKHTQQN